MMQIEKPMGKRGTKFDFVPWPMGYALLPDPGGLLDQDAYTMILFDRFLAGERHSAAKKVSK